MICTFYFKINLMSSHAFLSAGIHLNQYQFFTSLASGFFLVIDRVIQM